MNSYIKYIFIHVIYCCNRIIIRFSILVKGDKTSNISPIYIFKKHIFFTPKNSDLGFRQYKIWQEMYFSMKNCQVFKSAKEISGFELLI